MPSLASVPSSRRRTVFFIVNNPLAAPNASEDLWLFVLPIRRYKNRDRFSDHLFGLVDERPFGSLVKCRNDPTEVFADDRSSEHSTTAARVRLTCSRLRRFSIEFRKNRNLRADKGRIYGFLDIIRCTSYPSMMC